MESIPLRPKDPIEDPMTDDSDPLFNHFDIPNPHHLRARTAHWLWTLHLLFFLLSFSLLISACRLHRPSSTNRKCAEQLSAYSPFTHLVEYEDVRFQGSLFDTNPYKGPPNPHLDAAWGHITHMAQLRIPAEDMRRLKKPLTQVKVAEAEGDGYAGGIEVFHQLENKPAEFHDSNATLRLHVDHCIDMLRQVIQCNGDVGVVTRSWVKGRALSYPDFSVWHKCRKLEPMAQYSQAHEIDTEPTKFPDSLELTQPPCTNAAPDEVCP
ncbi:hypothetical protein ASPACDRAFT_1859603 [Aspergillus aculeatus ATCC 16872]|uniref:Uncharacterized protein n=1 Tax=Aspergillus aculeatus (strain ATCC 16872 / CBS 172.66 / WB 5094) TaxID=690307 RepID=A0A1L9WJS2_ASPA1|nr:uncharacterized protein ASPACDRAFT_1859603 [Aspergillus aculeatus ATCC 16872]OJJ96394.1 hypothetical protein ASPACDRAFT_1859603 [Aspergillus aculeatus ATCC 16872]